MRKEKQPEKVYVFSDKGHKGHKDRRPAGFVSYIEEPYLENLSTASRWCWEKLPGIDESYIWIKDRDILQEKVIYKMMSPRTNYTRPNHRNRNLVYNKEIMKCVYDLL